MTEKLDKAAIRERWEKNYANVPLHLQSLKRAADLSTILEALEAAEGALEFIRDEPRSYVDKAGNSRFRGWGDARILAGKALRGEGE